MLQNQYGSRNTQFISKDLYLSESSNKVLDKKNVLKPLNAWLTNSDSESKLLIRSTNMKIKAQ